MIRSAALVLLLAATPAHAQGYSEAQKADVVAAFVQNECKLNEADAGRILPRIGINMVVFAAVMDAMEQAGQVTWSDETETLTLAREVCK